MKLVILGLSITSSWGNGHATTFRGLVRELDRAGHEVLFLERDQPWYAAHRDLPAPPYGRTCLYGSVAELQQRWGEAVRSADAVILGSYVTDGVIVADWVQRHAGGITAFYDIDTPVTLAKLERTDYEYLHPRLIPGFDLYLSFTGGPTLTRLEQQYGAPLARALYCAFDPELYAPAPTPAQWDLGYLGTYSEDRQPRVERLLLAPARAESNRRFVVGGPMYPAALDWPANVERREHVPPEAHRSFYNTQRFTLNITRDDMIRAGYAPSVRLFEAAACGVPIISDTWPGIETFFTPGEQILLAEETAQVRQYLALPEAQRRALGEAARERVLRAHTAAHRARELIEHLREAGELKQARHVDA